MMRKGLFLVLALLLALPLAACKGAATPTPGATPPPAKAAITHFGTADLTGPYGILVPDMWEAVLDYYKWYNETKGGIDGHPVELTWGETGNVLERAWSHFKRFQATGKLRFYWIVSSPEGEAFKST